MARKDPGKSMGGRHPGSVPLPDLMEIEKLSALACLSSALSNSVGGSAPMRGPTIAVCLARPRRSRTQVNPVWVVPLLAARRVNRVKLVVAAENRVLHVAPDPVELVFHLH